MATEIKADGGLVRFSPDDRQPAWERSPRAYFSIKCEHDHVVLRIRKSEARRLAKALNAWADEVVVTG